MSQPKSPLPSHHFDLVSHWHLNSPVERVWSALIDPDNWPGWWPYVRSVKTLRTGDADGVGSVRRMEWSTRLPYAIVIEVEAVESVKHERLRGRSRGQLNGEGIWLLRSEGGGTAVTYLWRVELTKPWMRWLAPLLAPLFRWNHDGVMRSGSQGLARYLQATGARAASDAMR
jgi:carbon monoxide dehydrogenase subunit G